MQNPPRKGTGQDHAVGVGATAALSLRVSVGSLVRVLLSDPDDRRTLLALERTATLREVDGRPAVTVVAKPFGGGVRLADPDALREAIGDFHYDSVRSRRERDFRLLLHPASWNRVKGICRGHLLESGRNILDPSPQRELAEELADALQVELTPDQYRLRSLGMVSEDTPRETDSVRAPGARTVRVYYLFEARVTAPELSAMMVSNSRRCSDRDLEAMARREAERGGRGRANGVLVLGLDDVTAAYLSMPEERRSGKIQIGEHRLADNVLAILDGVEQSRYRSFAP